jgi:NADH dehydrogenase/NADH:ubiquinone oxidoreductase subunit G
MKITIDHKRIEATEGETILSVARRAGVDIPTLCHHEALESVGACRVCMVEVETGGEKRMVAACQYPVRDDLVVDTLSARVRTVRASVFSLLVARCPEVVEIRALAERYGEVTPYKTWDAEERCILCYLCTRTCAAVGPEAIAAVGRGESKAIAGPFGGPADACVGCGSCHRVCPTRCIEMKDNDRTREIWGKTFDFIRCISCGKPTITEAYRDYVVARDGVDKGYFDTCAACKAKETAQSFATVGRMPGGLE